MGTNECNCVWGVQEERDPDEVGGVHGTQGCLRGLRIYSWLLQDSAVIFGKTSKI